MVSFFWGLFITFIFFVACLTACAFLQAYLRLKREASLKRENTEKESEPPTLKKQSQPAVYYITSAPKKRKKPHKTQNIGLKGALMQNGSLIISDMEAIKKNAPKAIKAQPTTGSTAKKSTANIKAQAPSAKAYKSCGQPSTRSPSPQRRSR